MSRGAASNGAGPNDAGALAVRFGRGIQRSIAAFIVAIVALPLISLWATYQIRTLSARVVSIEETRLLVSRALRYTLDEETGLRGYLDTHERLFLKPYRAADANLHQLLNILPARFKQAGFESALPDLNDFIQTHTAWHTDVAHPLMVNPKRGDGAALDRAGTRLIDQLRADSMAIHTEGTLLVQQTTREMTDVILTSVIAAAVWVLFVAFCTIAMQRRAVKYENRLVETIVQEREEVQHLSEWRSRLLAMLAHDFKSQLTVLIGASHLLEDFPQRRGDPELLSSLRTASYSLAEMADNAILLARAQERKIVLQRTTFDITDVVESVVQRYGSERDFDLLRTTAVAMVEGDRSYVARVMDNIIGNAVKYSDSPVAVHVDDDGAFVRVSVIDKGIGISEQDLPHIFEEFWRSDRTWKHNGSGVGLFIVKTIMEAHGGDISVQSRYGDGTTVVLRFPRSAAHYLPPHMPVPA